MCYNNKDKCDGGKLNNYYVFLCTYCVTFKNDESPKNSLKKIVKVRLIIQKIEDTRFIKIKPKCSSLSELRDETLKEGFTLETTKAF